MYPLRLFQMGLFRQTYIFPTKILATTEEHGLTGLALFQNWNTKGISIFGQWFDKYDPKLHDAIMGPVEEFTALGFEEAASGGEFLKIGIGTLISRMKKNYSFAKTYEIKNAGKWSVKKRKQKIEFTHILQDAAGYSYIYKKNGKAGQRKPFLVLEHSLKNTGKKAIETSVYNHNFFTIDQEPTGPNITISFPFNVKS